MKKITSRKELLERLEEVRYVEEKAMNDYDKDVHTYVDSELVGKLQEMRDEEKKHVAILDSLINMLKN